MALEAAPGSYPEAKSRGVQALLPQFKSRLCCVTCGYVSLCASGASLQVGTVAALTSGVCEGDSEVPTTKRSAVPGSEEARVGCYGATSI